MLKLPESNTTEDNHKVSSTQNQEVNLEEGSYSFFLHQKFSSYICKDRVCCKLIFQNKHQILIFLLTKDHDYLLQFCILYGT